MADILSQLDLVFCVDLTSSMTPFIAAARTQMTRVLDALRATPDVDLCVAVVGYRDYGSIELTEIHPFAKDTEQTKRVLDKLVVQSPIENTDSAEAVFAGLVKVLELPWRAGSYRIAMLIGDAPPHGCGANARPYQDRYTEDPTGFSLDDVANKLEEQGIFLHALGMIPSHSPMHDAVLVRAFTRLAVGSGGSYATTQTGDAAMRVVETVSKRCVVDLDFDRRLFDATKHDHDIASLAKELATSTDAVNAGLMRLRQRGLAATVRRAGRSQ